MSIITKLEQLSTKIDNDKTLLASAITNKGVGTASTESLSSMAAKIEQIEQGSGGSLEPGSTIPFNSLQPPTEDVKVTGSITASYFSFAHRIGNKVYYSNNSSYLYCYNFDTEKNTRLLNTLYGFSAGLMFGNILATVAYLNGYKYQLVLFDTETESIIRQVEITSTESESDGVITGYGNVCKTIIKKDEDYYLLFGSYTAAKNFIVKITSDNKVTIRKLNTIDSTTSGYYYNMLGDENYIYIISTGALISIDYNLNLINKNTTVKASSLDVFTFVMSQTDDYIYLNTYSTSSYYKVNKATFSHQAISISSSNISFERIADNLIVMCALSSSTAESLYIYNNDFELQNTIPINETVASIGSFIHDAKQYIVVECKNGKIILCDTEGNMYWGVNYYYELNTATTKIDTVPDYTQHKICYFYNNKIYLFRKAIVAIDENPVYTVK